MHIENVSSSTAGGMKLPVLEAIVGHVDRETTKIYTHLQAGDLVKAVDYAQDTKLTVCNKCVTAENQRNASAG